MHNAHLNFTIIIILYLCSFNAISVWVNFHDSTGTPTVTFYSNKRTTAAPHVDCYPTITHRHVRIRILKLLHYT